MLGFVIEDDSEHQIDVKSPKTPQLFNQEENEIEIYLKSEEKLTQRYPLKPDETNYSEVTLAYLQERYTDEYQVSPSVITRCQHQVSWKNRLILNEWLMEVSDKFQLKRQTWQLSVYYVDLYLQKHHNYPIEQFQLLGITCLLIASKLEEIYYPKLNEFEHITDGNCSLESILHLERAIIMRLEWKLNPSTLNQWGNFYMKAWDTYQKLNPLGLDILDPSYAELNSLSVSKFKSDDNIDYLMFRFVMQMLDLALLDLDHYFLDYRHLTLSAIVLAFGLSFQVMTIQDIKLALNNGTLDFFYDKLLSNPDIEFSHMIINFVEEYCHQQLLLMKPALRYMMLYAVVPLQQQMPQILQDEQVSTQEEFFAYQVYYKDVEETMEAIQEMKVKVMRRNV